EPNTTTKPRVPPSAPSAHHRRRRDTWKTQTLGVRPLQPYALISEQRRAWFSPCCSRKDPARSRSSRRLGQMIDQPNEKAASVGAPQSRFHVIFRMRHHAEHVAARVDDASDGVGCAVEVPFGR